MHDLPEIIAANEEACEKRLNPTATVQERKRTVAGRVRDAFEFIRRNVEVRTGAAPQGQQDRPK